MKNLYVVIDKISKEIIGIEMASSDRHMIQLLNHSLQNQSGDVEIECFSTSFSIGYSDNHSSPYFKKTESELKSIWKYPQTEASSTEEVESIVDDLGGENGSN